MSDYLWDKTGEPDAEVERLEQLLGTLAHQPRVPELPDDARVVHAPRRRLTRPAMAFAAALALMLLAGAWLVATRRPAEVKQTARETRTTATPSEENTRDDKQQTAALDDKNTTGARQPETVDATKDAKDATGGRESGQPSSHQQSVRASRPERRPRAAVHANAESSKKNRGGVGAREEARKEELPAAVTERQQAAKAQLVYALRLTGAKLSEVQTKVRGASEERPASDGRNRIR